MTTVVLIRHGESRAQVERFLSGHDTCTGLSDRGRAQAELLRDRLLATCELLDVDAVYTSILPRAVETAEIISAGLGGITAQQECDWCEIHAGEAEGLTWDEFLDRYPPPPTLDPFYRRMPGAETWAEFFARTGTRLRRIAQDHPEQRVAIVCHGGVIGSSFVAFGDVGPRSAEMFTANSTNTSMTEWRQVSGEWRLVRYNDAAHLAGTGLLG